MPIYEVMPRHAISSGISYQSQNGQISAFEEWDACVGANLDLWMWDTGIYSRDFKARVIAWYQLKGIVDLHQNDVLATKAEQEAKKKGRR